MMPLDYAIALACIVSPQPIDSLPCSPIALQSVALSLELMDRQECRYLFVTKYIGPDFDMIHRRYAELKNAPLAEDATRFPDRETAREWIGFNRRYVSWLQERKRAFREEWIHAAIADAKELERIYDLVSDARCDYYYVTVRRKALLNLREAIGPFAYYAGTLPAVVPVWHFWRIDN